MIEEESRKNNGHRQGQHKQPAQPAIVEHQVLAERETTRRREGPARGIDHQPRVLSRSAGVTSNSHTTPPRATSTSTQDPISNEQPSMPRVLDGTAVAEGGRVDPGRRGGGGGGAWDRRASSHLPDHGDTTVHELVRLLAVEPGLREPLLDDDGSQDAQDHGRAVPEHHRMNLDGQSYRTTGEAHGTSTNCMVIEELLHRCIEPSQLSDDASRDTDNLKITPTSHEQPLPRAQAVCNNKSPPVSLWRLRKTHIESAPESRELQCTVHSASKQVSDTNPTKIPSQNMGERECRAWPWSSQAGGERCRSDPGAARGTEGSSS